MPNRRLIDHPSPHDVAPVEDLRRAVRAAFEALRLPVPDTFLGRKTYEPFPTATTTEEGEQRHAGLDRSGPAA